MSSYTRLTWWFCLIAFCGIAKLLPLKEDETQELLNEGLPNLEPIPYKKAATGDLLDEVLPIWEPIQYKKASTGELLDDVLPNLEPIPYRKAATGELLDDVLPNLEPIPYKKASTGELLDEVLPNLEPIQYKKASTGELLDDVLPNLEPIPYRKAATGELLDDVLPNLEPIQYKKASTGELLDDVLPNLEPIPYRKAATGELLDDVLPNLEPIQYKKAATGDLLDEILPNLESIRYRKAATVELLDEILTNLEPIPYDEAATILEEDDSMHETSLEDSARMDIESKNDSRIIGGQVANQIVPYQISMQLFKRNKWNHFCGGSIISRYHVISAAHCVERLRPDQISIVAGTLTWRTGGDRHSVVALRSHPGFSKTMPITNDIAVLKVKSPFQLNRASVAAISLGTTSRVGDRIPVTLTGWGSITPTGQNGLPDQLHILKYNTISNDQCRQLGFPVTPNEICALFGKSQGACVGDSGGPLVSQNQRNQALIGLVSYGSATCAQGKPDVYTRVSSFLPWINKITQTEIP